ncbi:hypothetical protein BG015_006841, partial [Linnemannia schmuckeri]
SDVTVAWNLEWFRSYGRRILMEDRSMGYLGVALENDIGTNADGVAGEIKIRSWDGSGQPALAKDKVESHRDDEKLDDRLEIGGELEANVTISSTCGDLTTIEAID